MIAPQAPEIFKTFTDILDYRPAFEVVALHLPLGLPSESKPGGRRCDQDARKLVGWPRSTAITSPPTREQLRRFQEGYRDKGLSAVTRSLLPRIIEVYKDIGSYHQRTVFETHPELSFFQLQDDEPLRYSKRTQAGRQERIDLLLRRIPGAERVIDADIKGARRTHLVDACAQLWTARRIKARAVSRLPENPEWDDEGLRMELVR